MPDSAAILPIDAVLVAAGAVSALVAWKLLRGRFSFGMTAASVGLIFLGLAHLTETLMWMYLRFMGETPIELLHRVFVLGGFVGLVYGLGRIGGELREERDRLLKTAAALIVSEEDLRLSNEELRQRNSQLLDAYARVTEPERVIRVLIAEPNHTVRRVLTSFLADARDMQPVGEAADDGEALALVEKLAPDVLLVSDALATPHMIEGFRAASGASRVLVRGTYGAGAVEALEAGAHDHVLKDAGHDRLLQAIRAAVEGHSGVAVDQVSP